LAVEEQIYFQLKGGKERLFTIRVVVRWVMGVGKHFKAGMGEAIAFSP